ncbi:hypothetical protein [Caenibius sp. WL]|uniref:hypothetical protein n=1 Tax=Caenibius sp. WL TaxID=2872646 RepID=UPI0021BD2029|nr:hypothetical protein [Caenibius sp. WL]
MTDITEPAGMIYLAAGIFSMRSDRFYRAKRRAAKFRSILSGSTKRLSSAGSSLTSSRRLAM